MKHHYILIHLSIELISQRNILVLKINPKFNFQIQASNMLNYHLICSLVLMTSCLTIQAAGEASITRPNGIKFPIGAFWIANYRNDIHTSLEPANWRTASNALTIINPEQQINLKGLENLYTSGSASPTLANMYWLKKNYGADRPVYIVDLRQETHLFINGLPISIFYKKDEINWGKTLVGINQEEQYWINTLLTHKTIEINKLGHPVSGIKVPTQPEPLSIKEVYTEAEAAQKAGIGYFRIDVPDYHPPAPGQVDQFLQFVKKIPAHSWLHFHCAAGKGRTTTFMVMQDILVNGTEIDLVDIVARQSLSGGINLFAPSKSLSTQPWKKQYHEARINFIKLFYTYIHEGVYPKQNFAQWINKQPDGPYLSVLQTEAYPQ